MTALSITIGRSRRNPRGRPLELPDGVSPARALATALDAQPTSAEAWWAPHSWRDGHRTADRWLSACAIGVDVDYHDDAGEHVVPPAASAQALDQAAREGKLPGSVFHRTPRGFRLVFTFAQHVTDRDVFARAARGAATLVQAALRQCRLVGYVVDEKALLDLARLLFSPRALVDGAQRDAEVLVLREEPFDPAALAPAPQPLKPAPALTLKEAAARYNRDHPGDWPRNSGDCPICGHKDCFGRLPDDPARWACFSTSHDGVGLKGPGCWHGDSLDLAAHDQRCTPAELLKREGYLSMVAPARPEQPPLPGSAGEPPSIEQAKLKGISKTYASLCAILRNDRRIIPEALEWNEMACAPTVGGVELEDHDVGRIRERIEITVTNSQGKPLLFPDGEVSTALYQVAHERCYHPVREYLEHLEWDKTPRIAAVVDELLGLERSQLHLALVTRWFIGAVARIFRPGCELQMVLVFCGNEDLGKSRFFKALAGSDWFSDERIDLRDKDARLLLQRVWFLEWGELAALKGSSWEDVKAFITSTTNDFRPPYGRKMARAPRHCVIVGTSNEVQFLHGREGERRFWPLAIPAGHTIPLNLVAEWRDQLWAEAVHLYRAGEQWHLTDEEKALLRLNHKEHVEQHPWEEPIAEWLAGWTSDITTSAVLEKAIRKPVMNWTKADEMVVGRCMRSLGYERERRRDEEGERVYYWTKAAVPTVPTLSPPQNGEVGT